MKPRIAPSAAPPDPTLGGVAEPRAERPDMPDYGLDTPEWSPLPWSWATERLAANRNFWLVTVSAAGRPHALPVWGVWDDAQARFAFSCGPRSRKARNLAANGRTVVMTDDTVECLSLEGRAAPVPAGEPQRRWIELAAAVRALNAAAAEGLVLAALY